MRRLILEISEKELAKLGIGAAIFEQIKSLELLHFLKQDQTEFAAIWRVDFKDPKAKVKNTMMVDGFLTEAQVLDQEKDGAYTVFLQGGPILSSVLNAVGVSEGYLFPPLEIRDGRIRMSFLGSEKQIRAFLEKLDEHGIRYKVVKLTNANFSPTSPLNELTEKQREILIAAYKHGYYDVPRKINSVQLAKKLKIANSTLIEHIRKSEHRILCSILNEQSSILRKRKI